MNMTREQAAKLGRLMQPHVGYVVAVRERMLRAGLDGDPLYKLLTTAENALRDFTSALHYRSCAMGVGQRVNDDQP